MSLPIPYYQDEAVTIYHGDCRDILPLMPMVDLVLTDPPYGVGLDYGVFNDNPENASLIARECQHCEDPVCREACPAGIDIPGFIRRIQAKNFIGAARLIREKNPFAETCG